MAEKHSLTFSRPLLSLCAGILLATVATAAICQYLIVDNLQDRSAQYGRALANLAARQAIDATLNHDLVSLQVILGDITENPDVTNATIHDVENNLLVQAGAERRDAGEQSNFTAPITLHNSIAGYVTVSIDLSRVAQVQHQIVWLFGLMGALLIALTLCALYFGRSWNVPVTIPRPAIPIVDPPPKPAARQSESEPEPAPAQYAFPRVELVVHIANLRELADQLDGKSFQRVSRRLEEHFKGILALYSGQLIQLEGGEARIAFPDPATQPDSAFQALCSAILLLRLNRGNQDFPLKMSALIMERDNDTAILRNLQYRMSEADEWNQLLHNAPDGSLLMERRLTRNEAFAAKVEERSIDDFEDIVAIVELNEPYQELLDRQLEQLRRGV